MKLLRASLLLVIAISTVRAETTFKALPWANPFCLGVAGNWCATETPYGVAVVVSGGNPDLTAVRVSVTYTLPGSDKQMTATTLAPKLPGVPDAVATVLFAPSPDFTVVAIAVAEETTPKIVSQPLMGTVY